MIKDRTEPVRKPSSSRGSGVVVLLLVLAAAAAGVWYVRFRPTSGGAGNASSGSGSTGSGAIATGPNVAVGVGTGEGPGSGALAAGSGSALATGSASAGSGEVVAAGSGSDVPNAGSNEEIDLDPTTAENPDPTADKTTAEDEAADAPKNEADVEKQLPAPPAPVRAQTVSQAVQMIKAGKRDLALASLNEMKKKAPKSAYIPFLLGNLYFDKLWWGVAIEHYRVAIAKNGGYRSNGVLIKNSIHMLASQKTMRDAHGLLRYGIGKPALPYLRSAAKSDPNANIRKQAAALAKAIR